MWQCYADIFFFGLCNRCDTLSLFVLTYEIGFGITFSPERYVESEASTSVFFFLTR